MHFTKMQGDGNDYVYVDCTKETLRDPAKIAKIVSDRHFGIGSDGLILIKPSSHADFTMEMYNADGSLGAMCGNGIRCVAKYVFDHGMTDRKNLAIETASGIKVLSLSLRDGKVSGVRVDMGVPILDAADIPILSQDKQVINEPIKVNDEVFHMTGVSMGNPHCVVFISRDPKDFPVETIGPLFEHHESFPDRVNAEFAHVEDEHTISMRVWERGTGETLACGTGACACAVAGILNRYVKSPVTVCLLGGTLIIEWDGAGSQLYMTGPAEEVFQGDIDV